MEEEIADPAAIVRAAAGQAGKDAAAPNNPAKPWMMSLKRTSPGCSYSESDIHDDAEAPTTSGLFKPNILIHSEDPGWPVE